MAAYQAASTSVPLMNMGSYQTFTKSEGITSRFARVAIPIFDRVVGFRDLLALALTYMPVPLKRSHPCNAPTPKAHRRP